MKLASLSSNRAAVTLMTGLIALNLAPLVWILVPPTVDGPAHLSVASALGHLLAHDRPVLERYFEINWFPEPNLLGHFVLILLLKILPPFAAEKALFGLFVAALPAAACYAIRSADRRAPLWPALLIVPFGWTKLVQAGFYNFCVSLPVFYVCLGYFLRVCGRLTAAQATVLGLLTLLLYFSHAMSITMFFAAVAILTAWRIWADRGNRPAVWISEAGKLGRLLAALAPAGMLYGVFAFRNRGAMRAYAESFVDRLMRLAVLSSLVTHRRVEMICSVGVLLLFGGLIWAYAARRPRPWKIERTDGYLAVCAFFVAFLFAIPDYASGGSAHSQRAELYPFLTLPLWFAVQPPLGAKICGAVAALATALAGGLWLLNVAQIHKIDGAVREYYSVAAHIEPGRTVLPIVMDRHGSDAQGRPLSLRCEIFGLAAGRLDVLSGAIDLKIFQATAPGFAVRYKPEWAQWARLGPSATWDEFGEELRAGGLALNPDYVLLYGWDADRIRAQAEFRNFDPDQVLDWLQRRYQLEYVSSPAHALQLYRRAGDTSLGKLAHNGLAGYRNFAKVSRSCDAAPGDLCAPDAMDRGSETPGRPGTRDFFSRLY